MYFRLTLYTSGVGHFFVLREAIVRKSKPNDPAGTQFAEFVLRRIYEEASGDGKIIWPDEAFKQFMDVMVNAVVSIDLDAVYVKHPRLRLTKFSSDIHHYAVEVRRV
jgi:hypothetical protein